MERFNSMFYFVILYSTLNLALEVNIMESAIIHKQKRSSKVEICSNTRKTITTNVAKCPNTDEEHLERSRIKDCKISCLGKPCVYHCVKYGEKIVEVCAPRETLIGRYCAIYDEGIGRVREDFSSNCKNCSFKYFSDECKVNSECMSLHLAYEKNKVNQTEGEPYQDTSETKNNQANGNARFRNTSLTSTDSSYSTSTRPSEHNKHVSGSQEETNVLVNNHIIVVAMMSICLVLSIGMVTILCKSRKSPKDQKCISRNQSTAVGNTKGSDVQCPLILAKGVFQNTRGSQYSPLKVQG